MAHEDIEKDCKIDQTVCSIAQDIVYGVSNRQKLTLKHVGLGIALFAPRRSLNCSMQQITPLAFTWYDELTRR